MKQELLAHADEAVRDALAGALSEMVGRVVLTAADGDISVATLRLSKDPFVAILGERQPPMQATDVSRAAANGKAAGEMGRHRYISWSTQPEHARAPWQSPGRTSECSCTCASN